MVRAARSHKGVVRDWRSVWPTRTRSSGRLQHTHTPSRQVAESDGEAAGSVAAQGGMRRREPRSVLRMR